MHCRITRNLAFDDQLRSARCDQLGAVQTLLRHTGLETAEILEGLILLGQMHPRASRQRLEPLRTKLKQLAIAERLEEEEILIEDIVGRIDPREPDVLQALRRQLRLEGKEVVA